MKKSNFDELRKFRDNLEALKDDVPQMMEELLVGEGVYCVRQARSIVTDEQKVDTGAYRYNFHCGNKTRGAWESRNEYDNSPPRVSGKTYIIDVYNNLDYASYLEMGFRSHWVPAKYLTPSLMKKIHAAQVEAAIAAGKQPPRKEPEGMYVGSKNGYVPGIWALKRAVKRTETTQKARLQRKMNVMIAKRLEGEK